MSFTRGWLLSGVVAVLLLCPAVRGDVEEVHYYVRIGDKVPRILAVDDQGKKWSSTAGIGKRALVLFFYRGRLHAPMHEAGARDGGDSQRASG